MGEGGGRGREWSGGVRVIESQPVCLASNVPVEQHRGAKLSAPRCYAPQPKQQRRLAPHSQYWHCFRQPMEKRVVCLQ